MITLQELQKLHGLLPIPQVPAPTALQSVYWKTRRAYWLSQRIHWHRTQLCTSMITGTVAGLT